MEIFGTANILVKVGAMHIQFLIEDISGTTFIKKVMDIYCSATPTLTVDYKAFRGIGGFPKSGNIKRDKTQKLLTDLTVYLKGFEKSLQGISAAIFIILDNDDRDTGKFYIELQEMSRNEKVKIDHVYCVAVEEVEAWLLGDRNALRCAYPNAKTNILDSYIQDSICGTWELLANAIYPGGLSKFKKDCPTFRERGRCKNQWAEEIGRHIDLHNNQSPSFQKFIAELDFRVQ